MKRHVAIAMAVVFGVLAGIGLDRAVLAQGGIERKILQQTDAPGSKTHQAVMGLAVVAPGGNAGRHRHPGIEMGYVLEGSVVVEVEGQKPVTKTAGEFFLAGAGLDGNGEVHNATNASKTAQAKILACYVVDRGKPLVDPVK